MNLVKFFETASKLKDVQRTGWVERGMKNPETSADHSLMVALIVLVLGNRRKLDMEKMLKMALVHDLPEAIVGDIISKDNWEAGGTMWNHEKVSRERPAMKKLSSLSGSKEILELWEEFEGQKTHEAIFVKEVDRLATIFQAMEYHKTGNYRKPLPGFWDAKALATIKDPELRKLLDSLLETI
jgi:5'-deoxynucleotidase YfbR-like HD superfamily hydrolase